MRVVTLWPRMRGVSLFSSRLLQTGATNIVLALLGLITGVLVARLLGAQGRGELAAIQIWASAIGTIAMLGLPEALVYFSAREPGCAGRYGGSAMALALLASLPFMAIGFLAMPVALSTQSLQVIKAARWYLLLVPIFALLGTPFHLLRGRNDFVTWNGLRLTPAIGWLAVLIVAYLLGRTQPEFVAASHLVMLALLFFPVMYILARRIPGPFWPELRKWRPMLRYGFPSMVSSMPRELNLRLGQLLMATFLPAQMLGLYVVAVAWSGAVHPMLHALGAVLFPRVASEISRGQQVEALAEGTRLGVLLALGLGLTLLVLTPFSIPFLFGEAFVAATPVALVLVVAAAIAGLNSVMEEGLRGLGVPTAIMWAEFGGLIVTAISLLLLLRPLEIMGAALASLFGHTAVGVLLLFQAQGLCRCSLAKLLCPTLDELFLGWRQLEALKNALVK